MTTKLFKTKKLAEAYIRENYPNCHTHGTSIDERCDYEAVDMPDLQWAGKMPALDVWDENNNYKTVATVAWWESGDEKYELYVGEELVGTYDNNYDARHAYDEAVEREEDKEPEEEEVLNVHLLCDGEDIS